MKVLKFGGGVLRTASDLQQMKLVLKKYEGEKSWIVVSAFYKVTSCLEDLLNMYLEKNIFSEDLFQSLQKRHDDFINNSLSGLYKDYAQKEIRSIFLRIRKEVELSAGRDYHFSYDQVVSAGELLSSRIVYHFLSQEQISCSYVPAQELIISDNGHQDANVFWEQSEVNIRKFLCKSETDFCLTQGFIAGTSLGVTTTLGREGSDFSASVLAYASDAEEVIFWKDVAGIYNADPAQMKECFLLPKITYKEAVEQAFYGAKILHPKTIKPLENKGIAIQIRSFSQPDKEGTKIADFTPREMDNEVRLPVFIIKKNQILLSLSTLDFSFVNEENLGKIFSLLSKFRLKINLMQSSAISFSLCLNGDKHKIPQVLQILKKDFKVLYNEGLTLVTIRHYTEKSIEKMTRGKDILLQQNSRHTVRFVLKEGKD